MITTDMTRAIAFRLSRVVHGMPFRRLRIPSRLRAQRKLVFSSRRIAMDDAKRFEVRQVIAAPIDKGFAAVADPGKHVRIDGSGMLQATDSGPVAEAGQTFVMD